MAGPSEMLSFVARRLIQFEQKFSLADLQRRRKASQLLSQIAASLHSLVAELGRDTLPHDPCRELVLYSTRLAEAVSEELGLPEAEKLAQALSQSSDQEKLYVEYRDSERKREMCEELEKASILIQALANGIYMSPQPEDSAPVP